LQAAHSDIAKNKSHPDWRVWEDRVIIFYYANIFSFAEKHFTSGRFAECEKRLAALLANSDVRIGNKIALRAIAIANLLALNQAEPIPAQLDTLYNAVAAQPDSFKAGWNFNGAQLFISQNEKLALYREWLLQLFKAMEGENREAVLAGLQEVRVGYHVVSKKE
jgi:hypothetical protein